MSDVDLFDGPTSIRIAHNKFAGEITIVTSFTNDPKYKHEAIWEYTLEAQKDTQNFYTITESGTVKGIGRPLDNKYDNALAFYNDQTNGVGPGLDQTSIESGMDTRINDFYTEASGRSLGTFISSGLPVIKSTFSSNETLGTISYSFTYTDNTLFSSGPIRKSELTVNITPPVHLIQKYDIFSFNEIYQDQHTSTRGKASFQISLKGARAAAVDVDAYLTAAKILINDNLPVGIGGDDFIESCQYSFAPEGNSFEMSLDYNFGGEKTLTDLVVD